MSEENFKLYTKIENFIDNNCAFQKNEPFIIDFINKKEALPIVQDDSNFIQCIMNIPPEKEDLIKDQELIKLNIIDSSFEFVLYKNNESPSVIKCLLLLIINDIEKADTPENEIKSTKKILGINNEFKILENLKKCIYNYIKENKKKKNKSSDNGSNNVLETILLAGAKDGFRFFNIESNGINFENENIKKNIEMIKKISSKLEIKQKKNEAEKNENKKNEEKEDAKETKKKRKKEIDNEINDVLDELNPDYKKELIYRYLDEMPEEIVNLMKKYKNISFTKNMYMEYLNKNMNMNIENIEEGNEEKIEELLEEKDENEI